MTNHPIFFILIVVFTGVFVSRYSRPIIILFLKKLVKSLPKKLQPALQNISPSAISILILWTVCHIGFLFISVEDRWQVFLSSALRVLLSYSLILICWQFLDILEKFIALRLKSRPDLGPQARSSDSITKHLLPYSKRILKVFSSIVIILLFLQNSGVNVTSLLAGLGLGGVAIALAAKETLSHFFGGFTVIMDKPFSVGDWIVCNKVEGTVEDIGFRSTKIKTFYDSLLTIPNSVIADSIIDNLGKRRSRRTRITLNLTYDSPPEKISAFVEGIKKIIQSNPQTRKDYYQCYFSGYGPHSLNILLNFFLKVSDWDSELLQKQAIFLEILKLAKKMDLKFAFPTRTLDMPHQKLLSAKMPAK